MSILTNHKNSSLDKARVNCKSALNEKYKELDLLADYLFKGNYRSFWKISANNLIQAESDNIFDKGEPVLVFCLKYVNGIEDNI